MSRVLNERGLRVYAYHQWRFSVPPGDAKEVTLEQRRYSKAYTDGMKSALEGEMEYLGRKDWQKTDLQKTAFQRGFDFVNSRGGEVYDFKKEHRERMELERIKNKSFERYEKKRKKKERKRK